MKKETNLFKMCRFCAGTLPVHFKWHITGTFFAEHVNYAAVEIFTGTKPAHFDRQKLNK
jgi:hypothetical protein